MHIDERSLLQSPPKRSTKRRLRGVGESRILAAQRCWKIGESIGQFASDLAGLGVLRFEQPRRTDTGLPAQPASIVNGDAGDRNAVVQHPSPRPHHAAAQRNQPVPVDREPTDGCAVNDFSRPGRKREDVAVLQENRRHTCGLSERRMGGEVPPLAVDRDGILYISDSLNHRILKVEP